MTLREIAEALGKITKWPWKDNGMYISEMDNRLIACVDYGSDQDSNFIAKAPEYIAFLIDAVVEERAKRSKTEFILKSTTWDDEHYEYVPHTSSPCHTWTDKQWEAKALHDLDLDKVWPRKEK